MTALLRHACQSCGGSCHGVAVPLMKGEPERIIALAAELGVERPINAEGQLRHEGGACAFLTEAGRCGIHAHAGMKAKPTLCQQFPLVITVAEDGPRAHIDPACYTAIHTWRDGPALPEGAARAARLELNEQEQAVEHRVLDMLELEGQTVAGALSGLIQGRPSTPGGLPEGYAGRLVEFIRASNLRGFLAADGIGRALPEALGPMSAATGRWIPQVPPKWPALSEEADAWAVEAVRRIIWLRLNAHLLRHAPAVALIGLTGAVLCGWTHGQDKAAFGRAYAGWLRAMRFEAFLNVLPRVGKDLNWLAGG